MRQMGAQPLALRSKTSCAVLAPNGHAEPSHAPPCLHFTGCVHAGPTRSTFLRLFLNRMDPSTQEAHYEALRGLDAEGVRDWVEGTVLDMT
jgi:hypothetical protein